MKIDGEKPHLSVDPSVQTGGKPSRAAEAGQLDAKAPAEDRVQFSAKAKEIQLAARMAAQTPEAREAKIAALKLAVESGTYEVNPEQIAEKMVKEALLEQLP